MGDSGDLLSVSGTCPSASAVHLASSPLVESHETQLGSEVGLTATTTTESTVTMGARQMDLPVGSPPSSALREAESNISLESCAVAGKLHVRLTVQRRAVNVDRLNVHFADSYSCQFRLILLVADDISAYRQLQ